jgi:serine/threonine protein kinase
MILLLSQNLLRPTAKGVLQPGDVLGCFQLLVPIGEGGMGRVWVAREQGSTPKPRFVAIKTALTEAAADDAYWRILLDEASIASQVHHPNVCVIHALDRERGIAYLVMDWSDAGSLLDLLASQPERRLDYKVGARIVSNVCAGLHAAHELLGEDGRALGVVHRDVSPQNILLSSNGQAKISDFGVAKARGQLHAPTQTGEVKGKISYMAPEQVTTRDVDRRADIFALGCVLYEATLGRRAFHGGDALATLYHLLEKPVVAPRAIDPAYPEGLERIVLKALERDPTSRYATAEDMARALSAWLLAERALIDDAEIAKLVKAALSEPIAARLRAVNEAIAQLDAPSISNPEPATPVTLSGAPASERPTSVPERRHTRTALAASLATLAIAAGVGLAFGFPRSSAARMLPFPELHVASFMNLAEPRAASTPTAAPAPNERISITLRARPSHAALFVDDGTVLPNPYRLDVFADSRLHRVRASASGHADAEQSVSFDRSKEIVIVLAASAKSARTTGTLKLAPAPAQTERRFGELPQVVKKPPRTLDSENPFANR